MKTNQPSDTAIKPEVKSARLYARALKVMPGGCSRNTILRKPHPDYVERGEGCVVYDVDGHKRIDFANNMASLIHGHADEDIVSAVSKQLHKGTAYTMATEVEIEFAEHMCDRNRGFDKIRFVNSGTEAVMSCLKAARAYTGRAKIAKVEGAYHGLYDYAEVSQTSNPANWGEQHKPASVAVAHGTPASALDEVVVIPFNDEQKALKILDEHADELACVLLDPLPHRVGLVPASAGFVEALYQWTRTHRALLVFDEVITFRSCYGGAQEQYQHGPDLTAMGKMIGGGFPAGALAGREEVMNVMDPLADKVLFPHSGTFSANPVTMTAGLVAMQKFDAEAVRRLNALGSYARKGIREAINVAAVPACVTGVGSMLRVHMKADVPEDYRAAYATAEESQRLRQLLDYLYAHGVIMINTCTATLSTPMGEAEIDRLCETLLDGLRQISWD